MSPPTPPPYPGAAPQPSTLGPNTKITLGFMVGLVVALGGSISSYMYTKVRVDVLVEEQVRVLAKVDGAAQLAVQIQQHGERLAQLERWREEDARARREEQDKARGDREKDTAAIMGRLDMIITEVSDLKSRLSAQEALKASEKRIR